MCNRPKIFINIATNEVGGPGKGLLQFLRCGGQEICDPIVVGFSTGGKSQFDEAMEKTGVPFELMKQRTTYDPMLIFQAIKVIKKYNPDILQSHGYKSHLICFLFKFITRKPWIAFFHGWTTGGIKLRIYRHIDKFVLGFSDRLVTVSQGMVDGLNKEWIGEHLIYTIRNAVDPNEFDLTVSNDSIRDKYGINISDPLVAVVGRFSLEKGHKYFVEALPQIIQKVANLKVMLIGDGSLKGDIQQQVAMFGLNSHVIFTGYQSDVQSFYREIDLLVLPSLSEGMPNVALEAMLFGKPVLATRVGGVPEVVVDEETGIIVDPQNPEQLAGAVIRLFENRDMLLDLGAAGRKRVLGEFDPVQRVKKIAAMYEDVQRGSRKNR